MGQTQQNPPAGMSRLVNSETSLHGLKRPSPAWDQTMPKGPQGQKRPGDVIGAAIMVARIATGEVRRQGVCRFVEVGG